MVINFKLYKINRGMCKLIQMNILIIIKKNLVVVIIGKPGSG